VGLEWWQLLLIFVIGTPAALALLWLVTGPHGNDKS
jgi:hypothetical protein